VLSIIIPVYRERENLGVLIPRIVRAVKGGKYEIVVVDDNSGDGTDKLVRGMSRRNPSIRLLERKGKLGLASAIAEGVSFSKGESILVMDGDLSHPPEKIRELGHSLSKYDLVIGSRNMPGGAVQSWPLERKLISGGATFLARLLVRNEISDPMSGFFAVRRSVFGKTRLRVRGYKVLLNILVDNPGIRIKEIPYLFKDRYAGSTKLGGGEVLRYLADLSALRLGRGRAES
jgi:dolichol-phosphate mannosyltransferase